LLLKARHDVLDKSISGKEALSHVVVMLELPDWEFKTIIINTLKSPMDKADSTHEHMGNVGIKNKF